MKRREFMTRSAMGVGAAALGTGSLILPGCAGPTFGPVARVRDYNGSPTLFVDGEPIPPMTYTGNPTRPGYVKGLADSGIRVYFVSCGLDWFKPDQFENLRQKVTFILDNHPEAYIILRTRLHPPVQWMNDNPDELVRYENGETMEPTWAIHQEYKPIGMYSLASDKWRQDGGAAVLDFIDQLEASEFGDRVIGFFLAAGGTSEWYYPGTTTGDEHYAGNSPTFKRNFAHILKETYGTEAKLREAWNDPTATFDDPKIPDLDDRYFSRVGTDILDAYLENGRIIAPEKESIIGSFLNPDSHKFVADYYKAWHFGTADSVIHFARVIKKRTRGTKVVGAFYGSYGCTHFQETGTVSGVLRILDSGYIDFLAAPGNYENRHPGGVTAQREMQDSFRLRGSIFLVEEDTRTHLASELNRNFTGTHTLEDSITNMKRDFGRDICEDLQAWWFDMAGKGGWYDHPDLLALIKRQQQVARKAIELDRRISAEIALLYDHDSTWYSGQRTNVDLCHMMRNLEIHRIGAPVSYHFHDDLALDNMPDYKLYVFLNTFVLTDDERKAIEGKVKTGGRTALWVYAPGIINPEAGPRFSTDYVGRLTGMKVAMDKGPALPTCRMVPGSAILKGVATDRDYGRFDREMFGDVANIQPPGPAWTGLLHPFFYGDDPQADVLARFRANDKPAMTARDFGTWRSVHAFFQAVRSDILRAVARYAGCHIHCETDDILYANRHFVTLHASVDGPKVIRLPKASDPFEIYERKTYGKNTREIRFNLKRGETRTFYLKGTI